MINMMISSKNPMLYIMSIALKKLAVSKKYEKIINKKTNTAGRRIIDVCIIIGFLNRMIDMIKESPTIDKPMVSNIIFGERRISG